MQFKASQRLRNPNEENASSNGRSNVVAPPISPKLTFPFTYFNALKFTGLQQTSNDHIITHSPLSPTSYSGGSGMNVNDRTAAMLQQLYQQQRRQQQQQSSQQPNGIRTPNGTANNMFDTQ
uniref:Uncharacterized protein n=1 Tax=Panagrolaimus sp. ES5 TaxID=591445 RepID=A0AC34FTS7_9BILA